MSREILIKKVPITGQITISSNSQEDDPYLSKVVKLVPAEVISVYLGIFNLIKSAMPGTTQSTTLQWIFFAIIAIITPFYLKKVARINSVKQIILCEISFFIWVLSIGGPLDGQKIGDYSPQFIGALIVPLYTLFIPLFTFPANNDIQSTN